MLLVSVSVCLLAVYSYSYIASCGEVSRSKMEPFVFDHSDKNIPVHDDAVFRKMFINAVATLDYVVRWAAHIFLNPHEAPKEKKNASDKIVVNADKTSNKYFAPKVIYEDVLEKSINTRKKMC